MALYNNGFPVNYPQYYNMGQPQIQNMGQPQIQNSGFIPVPSEMDARNYPVAPGNSVTFKDEKLPYVYVKTMGFSQLDRPVFEKFRLVKEQDIEPNEQPLTQVNESFEYAKTEELDMVSKKLDTCQLEIEELKKKISDLEKPQKAEVKKK